MVKIQSSEVSNCSGEDFQKIYDDSAEIDQSWLPAHPKMCIYPVMDMEQYSEVEITYTCNISNYSPDAQECGASKIELVDPTQSEPQPKNMLQNLGVEKPQECDVSNYSNGQQYDASGTFLINSNLIVSFAICPTKWFLNMNANTLGT